MNQHDYDEPLNDHHQNEWIDWPGNPVKRLFDDHHERSIPSYLPYYNVEHHNRRRDYMIRLFKPLKKIK